MNRIGTRGVSGWQFAAQSHRLARGAVFVLLTLLLTSWHVVNADVTADSRHRPVPVLPEDQRPKNVILMIADGAGYNTLASTRYWTGQPLVVDDASWRKVSLSTHSLRGGKALPRGLELLEQDPVYVYDPTEHYNPTPLKGIARFGGVGFDLPRPKAFVGYEVHRNSFPDSASTMTAMMTGVVTYNDAINVDGAGQPLVSVPELAKAAGKRVGTVTTVPFNHATVASGAGAHSVHRNNYIPIAREMFTAGVVDVIGGAGHPMFDDDGQPKEFRGRYVARDDWDALAGGTLQDARGQAWTLVDATADIQALAEGDTPPKLAMIARAGSTLQQKRTPRADRNNDGQIDGLDALHTFPGQDPPNSGLPTLVDLTRAALNAVDDTAEGFFLHIEGGAVDWAMHDNHIGRMIEEQIDFNDTIAAVVAYLDADTNGNNWDNTLVIVTADHDHMLFGPDGDTIPFQPVTDNGPGELPGHQWFFDHHSALPVPFFARGKASESIIRLADKTDRYGDETYTFGTGLYLHQTQLGQFLKQVVSP